MSKPDRKWMKINTSLMNLEDKWQSRIISVEDAAILAELMDMAYQGTIDHEGETLDQCLEEMRGTLGGKYGAFLNFASFCAISDNAAISASIVTFYKGIPLLAYSMTSPDFQGKGIGRYLIERSIDALAKHGYPDFYLVVTSGNRPAENLYARVGFKYLGSAKPGDAPPIA